MADRLVKCYGGCDQKYPKSQMLVFSNKNHCPTCHTKKVQEKAERELLYKYLQNYFNISFPTGLMLRQIKGFVEERNYTLKNIRFTLDYIIRIKKMTINLKSGIALVPHFYEEMLEYYRTLNERRSQMVLKKTEIVTVKLKPFVFENEYKNKKLINMEALLDDSN